MRQALSLALLLTLALAALPALAVELQENYYPVGRFAVAGPGHDVQYQTSIVEQGSSAVIHHEFAMTDISGDTKVMVLYVDLGSAPDPATVDAMFQDTFAGIAREPMDNGSATLAGREATQWEGRPTLDFTLLEQTPAGERWLKVRAVVAGDRYYVLQASAPDARTCDKVLQSFWIAP